MVSRILQRMYDAAHDPAPLMQQTFSSQKGAGALTEQVFLSHRSSRQPTKQYLAKRRSLMLFALKSLLRMFLMRLKSMISHQLKNMGTSLQMAVK